MCEFASGVMFENGDLVMLSRSQSHTQILASRNVRDCGMRMPGFVRLEYRLRELHGADPFNLDNYYLNVDQDWTPDWWNGDRVADATRKMRAYVERCIVREDRQLLADGIWLLAPGVKIDEVLNSTLQAVSLGVRIGEMALSNVSRLLLDTGIRTMNHCQIGQMGGTTRVDTMEHCTVDDLRDAARVNILCFCTVDSVRHDAEIGDVTDSRVDHMYDRARLHTVRGASYIASISGIPESVGTMWDSATIRRVKEPASVREMNEETRVLFFRQLGGFDGVHDPTWRVITDDQRPERTRQQPIDMDLL